MYSNIVFVKGYDIFTDTLVHMKTIRNCQTVRSCILVHLVLVTLYLVFILFIYLFIVDKYLNFSRRFNKLNNLYTWEHSIL